MDLSFLGCSKESTQGTSWKVGIGLMMMGPWQYQGTGQRPIARMAHVMMLSTAVVHRHPIPIFGNKGTTNNIFCERGLAVTNMDLSPNATGRFAQTISSDSSS